MTDINVSLSGYDILNALDNKCNMVQYKDVKNFNSINEMLGPYKKCVLLYHTKLDYGHWTCLYEVDNTIFFFDSYGFIPDKQLNWVPYNLKDDLNSDYRYLTKLLYESNKRVEYNEYQFQRRVDGVNTCGRWVVNRLKYPEISIENFNKLFKDASKYMDLDELICLLVPI